MKNNLTDIFYFLDWIPSNELSNELALSSILLLFHSFERKTGTNGIIYTKLFEYLALNRNILFSPTDASNNERIIKHCNAGFSVNDISKIENILVEKYDEWSKFGFVRLNSDRSKVEEYSRQKQAKQFLEIFKDSMTREL